MEFEAIDEGRIAQILVPEGTDNVKVGTVIATIAGEGEETSSNSVRAEPVEAPSLPSTPSEEKDSPSTSSGQTEEKARKPAPTERASDPAIPAGTTMTRLTVRDRTSTRLNSSH